MTTKKTVADAFTFAPLTPYTRVFTAHQVRGPANRPTLQLDPY
jgi:hypothetical protein